MRVSIIHVLVALLIAVFAIGSPRPGQADCAKCETCSVEIPAGNEAPCPQKGLACQIAQTCVSQVQKAPAQIAIHTPAEAPAVAFGRQLAAAEKSASLTPETAPPRT
jgi:hypothetical protein